MCNPMMVALMAGAQTLSATEAHQEEKRQRRVIQEGADEEARIQKRGTDATKEYVAETYDPTQRLQSYETEAASRERALGELLASQEASGKGGIDAGTAGAVSDSYTQARAKAAAETAKRSRNQSRLMARAGATGSLFGNEALAGGDYASNMLGLSVDSRLNRSRTEADARHRTSDLALLGGLLQSAGMAAGGGR